MQYSVRGIAPEIDAALRNRARAEGKSLNAIALEVLAEGVGLGEAAVVRRDLSDVAGSWRRDARIEKALADQDEIDEALWK
jgi:plasmid stability protein